jgi:hypothetical protein
LLGSPYGGGLNNFQPENSFKGLIDSFFARTDGKEYTGKRNFLFDWNDFTNESGQYFNTLAIYLLVFIFLFIVLFPFLWKKFNRGYFALVLTFSSFILIGVAIEPFYFEFWVIPAEIIIFLFALYWDIIAGFLEKTKLTSLFVPVISLLFIIPVFALFSWNVRYELFLQSRNYLQEGTAKFSNEKILQMKSPTIYKNPLNPYGFLDK